MKRSPGWFRAAGLLAVFFGAAAAALAFDVKQKQDALAARSLALPRLAANYDQAKVDLFLTQPVWTTWNQAHGGAWTAQFDTLTGRPRRVFGGAVPWIAGPANSLSVPATDLERVARDFIASNASVIGVGNDRLRFVPDIASPAPDGHMHYAAFDYMLDGVPVETGRLIFAVNNGNMIYWSSTNIADVPTVTRPSLTADQAFAALLAYSGAAAADVAVVEPAALRLIPQNTAVGGLIAYRLVYEAVFRLRGGEATWAGEVDAGSGAVIAFGDVNQYQTARTSAPGRVTGGVRPAMATDPEVVRSFPFVAVDTPGGPVTTTWNGLFSFTGGTVSTGLNGRFFGANCSDCIKSQSDPIAGWQPFVSSFGNGRLALGTGGFDVVTDGQSTKSYGNGTSTPADRTAFFHTNVARAMAKKWLDLPWLNDAKVGVTVNINDACNAFWDGTSLNFFKAGNIPSVGYVCANTGEIRDVMQHEWGHGLDSNDGRQPGYSFALGLGDLATGEGVGDHIALFVDHDSCIGQSFFNRFSGPFLSDPESFAIATCDGVRNLDELRNTRGNLATTNVEQKCPMASTASPPFSMLYIGPLLREGHCEGEIYGQFGWHLVQDLINGTQYGTMQLDANKQYVIYGGDPLPSGFLDGSPNPSFDRDLAWTIHERLFFQSAPMRGSYAPSRFQAIGPSVYDAYIVTDDEGDGLLNGTPHAAYINDAAVHHGIEEWGAPGGRPSAIDSKNCDAVAVPSISLAQSIDASSGTPAVTVSWNPVSGAASYSVLRSERRHDVFLEMGRVSSGTSFTDLAVDNGVTYFYRVQANGSSACWNASGGGLAAISIAQAEPRVESVTVTDSPGGNKDGGLDPGEKAQLFVVLTNAGLANLTGVSALLSSNTPGVSITSAGPKSYGTIAPGGSAGPKTSFAIALDSNGSLCGKSADFILSIASGQGSFVDSFSLSIGNDGTSCVVYKDTWAQPTSIAIASDRLNSLCGDGDLIPDPGETIQVAVTVNNTGTKSAGNVLVGLSTNRSYFSFVGPSTVNLGTIASQGSQTKTATFTLSVGRSAPFLDLATLTASVTATGQSSINSLTYATTVNRDKALRDFSYDFETGAQGWTSSDPANGWTLTNMAVTTGDLTNLWFSRYAQGTCTYLNSPAFEFSASSKLAFDLAYLSEGSDDTYDGTDVQISVDGGKTWQTVELNEGYPALSYGDTCVPADAPFFSGYGPLMSHYTADLSAFAGTTGQIRFRWAVDGAVEIPGGGTWVDNIGAIGMMVSVPSTPCP